MSRGASDLLFSRLGKRALVVHAALTFAFLYFPIVVLVVFSFNDSPILVFPLSDLSLKWYGVLFADRDILHSVINSFTVAGGVVPLTLLLGVPLAFALDRFAFFGKGLFERAMLVPLIVPGLITGLSILLVFSQMGVPLSLISVIVGHSIFLLPVVVIQVYARLRRFDRTIEEASMDLGADRWQTFWRVTLPNVRTAILGSALLVYTLSFDEVAITFFLTGNENTLPMHIWSLLRHGFTPEINAIGTITVSVSVLLIALSLRLLGGTKRRGEGVEGRQRVR